MLVQARRCLATTKGSVFLSRKGSFGVEADDLNRAYLPDTPESIRRHLFGAESASSGARSAVRKKWAGARCEKGADEEDGRNAVSTETNMRRLENARAFRLGPSASKTR